MEKFRLSSGVYKYHYPNSPVWNRANYMVFDEKKFSESEYFVMNYLRSAKQHF